MVFGFGKKKRQKPDDEDLTDAAYGGQNKDGRNDESPVPITQPNRPGSMGTIHASVTSPAAADSTSAGSHSIKLGEIPEILLKFDDARRARTVSTIKRIRNDAEPMIDELIQMGQDLEKDDLNVDSIDKHLAIIVVRGKKQVIDIIRRGVVKLPDVNTVEDATKAESLLRQLLKKVGDVLGRQTRVIHIFAKKHANRFKENLETLNSQHVQMRDVIRRHNADDSESQGIHNALDALARRQTSRNKRAQRMRDLESAIADLNSQASDLNASFLQITSSKEHKEYVNILSEIKKCDGNLSDISNEINLQFEKVSRPLGRYEYGSSLDKSQQRILAGLVSNPAHVLVPENLAVISDIISNVRRAVASGSISVRDTEKALGMLAETADSVKPFVSRISECTKQRESLSDASHIAKPAGLDECKERISKTDALLADHGERLALLRAELREDDSVIPGMLSEIQVKLRQYTGIKYDVAS